ASFLSRHGSAKILPWASVAALAAACGTQNMTQTSGTTSGTTGMTSSSGGHGGGGGGAGGTTLSLPQLVHGTARGDTIAFPQIPIVVGVTGAMPDSVDVTIDGSPTAAQPDGGGFVATVATTSFTLGPHMLVAEAKSGGSTVASVSGTLVVGTGSMQFTKF